VIHERKVYCYYVRQGKRIQSILSTAGDYEVWLSTQLMQLETDDVPECGSQSMFDEDVNSLPFGLSELPTQQFDSKIFDRGCGINQPTCVDVSLNINQSITQSFMFN